MNYTDEPSIDGAADAAAATPEKSSDEKGWDWAIVEIYGHRRHAGRIREEERFGSKMLRIDIPTTNEAGDKVESWTSHFYGGNAIFSLTLSDEATILRANKPSPWDRPRRLTAPVEEEHSDSSDYEPAGDLDGGTA